MMTDAYAQASCTAGRAADHRANAVAYRHDLGGFARAPLGIQPEDPTLAELLKPLGYTTAQIGKNHLGDRNEFLPTVHGFDQFYGNLYHLNAEEEPEQPDYPKTIHSSQALPPRGVLETTASEIDDPTEDPRFGRVGKQVIRSTPVTLPQQADGDDRRRSAGATRSISSDRANHASDTPFFLWHNTTRMHVFTHSSPSSANNTRPASGSVCRWHARARLGGRRSCWTSWTSWALPTTRS